MRKLASLVLAVAALGWAAAACVPQVKKPEVRLAGVRVGGLGLQGGLLYVRVGVVNPNGFGILARNVTYDIELTDPAAEGERWVRLAEGVFAEPIQVEGGDSTVVEIPIEFRYSGVGGAIRSLLEMGSFQYRIRGEVAIDEPIRTQVPYQHRGTVSLMGSD